MVGGEECQIEFFGFITMVYMSYISRPFTRTNNMCMFIYDK